MKLKKFALKGLAILTVVLALCAFFSGTIRTITTPKVQLTQPRMGKLEEKIELSGKVYFPETVAVSPELDEDITLTVKKVNTRAGYTVEKGDVLVEAEVTGYAEKLEALTKEYESAENSLSALERKNADMRVRPADENYVTSQSAYKTARSEEVLAKIAVDTLLAREDLELNDDGTAPKGASDELVEAISAYAAAQEKLSAAEKEWTRAKRYSIDETVYAYLTEKTELEQKLSDAQEGIRTLSAANAMAAQLVAPHDGFTAVVNVAEGEAWDGKKPMIEISAKKSDPVLRADITDIKRSVSKKADVSIEGRYGSVESRVSDVVTDTDGRKYAYVDINKDVLNYVGSVYSMMSSESGKQMTITYTAKDSTCLVPVSAVHGSGEDRYVFVVQTGENAFGTRTMTVRKTSVTVEAEVEGIASLQEDISWQTIAYMEDRAIEDGVAVMEYGK